MEIRRRSAEDLAAVQRLLVANDLPLNDLEQTDGWVAVEQEQIAGHIALELYEQAVVLRSLVVSPEMRQKGAGRLLFQFAERMAAGRAIYLRTRTINPWVERMGYTQIGIDTIPAELKASAEFGGSICSSVPIYRKPAEA